MVYKLIDKKTHAGNVFFCDSWPWPLTFLPQNKWISMTYRVCTCISSLVNLTASFGDIVQVSRQTDTQINVGEDPSPQLPSAWVTNKCRHTAEIFAWPSISSGDEGSSIHFKLYFASGIIQSIASSTPQRWFASTICSSTTPVLWCLHHIHTQQNN